MEKILLSKLDPKAKEHQRKKVLRIFFSWNSKQPNSGQTKFWNWVKSLSPDNLSSSERFKSMSYEFLDKLISKKIFRESLKYWINESYLPTLTQSAEDEHTRDFLQFVINSIEIKEKIEASKMSLLNDEGEFQAFCGDLSKVVDIPNEPGIYIEFRCLKNSCVFWRHKHFAYLGEGIRVELIEFSKGFKCVNCKEDAIVINFGVNSCKFWVEGDVDSWKDLNSCYSTLDEFHFSNWTEMWVQAKSLTPEDKSKLEKMVMEAFSDTKIPKKKYCKRKGVEKLPTAISDPDIASSILMLEKEIKDLDTQIYDLLLDSHKNYALIQSLKLHLPPLQI